MSLHRMIAGLEAALDATKRDPADRYQSAMIKRSEAILERSKECPVPELALGCSANELASLVRKRRSDPLQERALRSFVRAKLDIFNPDYD